MSRVGESLCPLNGYREGNASVLSRPVDLLGRFRFVASMWSACTSCEIFSHAIGVTLAARLGGGWSSDVCWRNL